MPNLYHNWKEQQKAERLINTLCVIAFVLPVGWWTCFLWDIWLVWVFGIGTVVFYGMIILLAISEQQNLKGARENWPYNYGGKPNTRIRYTYHDIDPRDGMSQADWDEYYLREQMRQEREEEENKS